MAPAFWRRIIPQPRRGDPVPWPTPLLTFLVWVPVLSAVLALGAPATPSLP